MAPHMKLLTIIVISYFVTLGSAQLITVCGGASITFPCQDGLACPSNQWTFQRCNTTTGNFEIINPEGNCGLTKETQLTLGVAVGVSGAAALALALGLGIGLPPYLKKRRAMIEDMKNAAAMTTRNPAQQND